MSGRDTTVGGLIRYLQELIEDSPEVTGYSVNFTCPYESGGGPWHGTSFIWDKGKILDLEGPD